MSTQQATTKSKWVEVVCGCGKHFSLRKSDYQKRKKDSGREPSCSVPCGMKYRQEQKVSMLCECGCGRVVTLSVGRLKGRRTSGERIFFSRDCGRKLKSSYQRQDFRSNFDEQEEEVDSQSCCWCDNLAIRQNSLKGKDWSGACRNHIYKLSAIMAKRANQIANQVVSQVIVREERDMWDKNGEEDWFWDHLVVGASVDE